MQLSFSLTKTMNESTLPLKGEAAVTVTLTMEAELAAKPRDILIAWDRYGKRSDLAYPFDVDTAIRTVLEKLVGLTGGADGKLGNGSRVALYGNRSNTGEIRTALTEDTAVLLAAMDAAKADPQPGLALVADSMVEMLAPATGRKTLLICVPDLETVQNAEAKAKLEAAGVELFQMSGPRLTEAEPWGGPENFSSDQNGPAMAMAGLPQNLLVEDYLGSQFRAKKPMEVTTGELAYEGPVIGKPRRLSWAVGLPQAVTGVQTYTMTYQAANIGPDAGPQTVSTLHAWRQDEHGGDLGEELTGLTGAELSVDVSAAPAALALAEGGMQVEDWPVPMPVKAEQCKDAVQATIPDAQMMSLGRLVQLDVVLKRVCPGKRISATILLTETDPAGVEQTRAIKHVLVPAQTGATCEDVTLRCVQFSVPEALDLTGEPTSLCNERSFNVRVIANYVDSDVILYNTNTVTV